VMSQAAIPFPFFTRRRRFDRICTGDEEENNSQLAHEEKLPLSQAMV